ncbi:small multidrug efflux protein [Arthrobacter sp. Helios]|uniref:small multidrug efflux protein n=1 Tax=Arthrobacter sp. Helios TaxID=2828862 RepID=UPI002047448F|nr:small multidrug efflux protein [Arthrobacter sp. Helios]UPO78451.1 small multidrug efflux protein [Arthrobacter sp. Helios]
MSLIETFQNLAAEVPELLQPVVVAAAGAVPFIEGEGAATIGLLGGLHPVAAAAAAMIGNFLCVALLVLIGSGARDAVVTRSRKKAGSERVALAGAGSAAGAPTAYGANENRMSPRRAKFQRAYERFGVPGVSLLGPLLLPTQFTATMLVATGISKARVLVWQAIAILGWTTATTIIIARVLAAVS